MRVSLRHGVSLLLSAMMVGAPAAAVEARQPCGHPGVRHVAYQKPTEKNRSADIVDTAVGAGSFKTLATALAAADLVDVLKGKGPFTVFAPTDEAFAKLPPGTVEALLKDKEKLKAVLTYHVVSGKVMASEIAKMKSATTL